MSPKQLKVIKALRRFLCYNGKTITDTKSLNRFSYVEGNLLTYVDPNVS